MGTMSSGDGDRREAGFTILEVLIAAVVVAIGIVGLISAISSGLKLSETSNETQIAVSAARRKIEEIRAVAATDFTRVFAYNGQTERLLRDPAQPFNASTNPDLLPLQPGDTAQLLVTFLTEAEAFAEFSPTLPAGYDFNGNGTFNDTSAPVSGGTAYAVKVRVRWQSEFGARATSMSTLIVKVD